MKKKFDSKKLMKSFLTKEEIRYAEHMGWKVYPTHMDPSSKWGLQTTVYDTGEECIKACKARQTAIRGQLSGGFRKGVCIDGKYHDAYNLAEWIRLDDERIRFEKRMKRENDAIDQMCHDSGLVSVFQAIMTYNTGEHIGDLTARYGDNGIICIEDREKYSNRCRFMKTVRSFVLTVRRGWKICRVGGLLTFYRGKFDRTGMACEWIEQGLAIDSFRTVKGFLVRGEHIEAKSLKAAIAINKEHRAQQLARTLRERRRLEKRISQIADGSLQITLNDSLASGNCLPGTQQFKRQYEAAIGHEAKSISIADLMKYGKKFGVEYYAERVIKYVLSR